MTVLQTIELDDAGEHKGVSLRLEVLVEDLPLEGNVLACGDDEEDAKAEQTVRDEYAHNDFAWCTFRVVAELENYPQIFGDDYLGGVSILEKFLVEGETLDQQVKQMIADHDMIGQALQCLNVDMAAAQDSMNEWKDAQHA